MIEAVRIENFRCFKKLELDNFGIINVIVGSNSAGKTALLEALFLPGGNAGTAFQLELFRGLQISPTAQNRDEYESLWKDLFFDFSSERRLKIEIEGSTENRRTLEIYYEMPKQIALSIPIGGATGPIQNDSNSIVPITFETRDSNGKRFFQNPQPIANGGFITGQSENAPTARIALFPSTHVIAPQLLAAQFSDLNRKNQDKLFKKTLRDVFPIIKDLSVQVMNGNVPALFCEIDGVLEKMPLNLVSAGINKLVGILLAISTLARGVVLVDEIENGLYYRAHEKMWSSLFNLCKATKTQLFTTTHSLECLQNLIPILSGSPNDFRLIRMEKDAEGKRTAKMFQGKEFEAALEIGSEFR